MIRGKERIVDWGTTYKIKDLRLPETQIKEGSRLHTVRSGDMLDMIAYMYYRDESLWYIIADVNEIMDVFQPLTPGMQIVIPLR